MTTHRFSRRLLSALAGGATALAALAVVPGAVAPVDAAAPVEAVPALGGLWSPISEALPAQRDGMSRTVHPSAYAAYRLALPELGRRLATAPAGTAARGTAATIAIPAPSGELVRFAVREVEVMEPGLAAARPDIATYAGRSLTGPPASIRLDTTPLGFHASVRGASGSWYVDPAYIGADQGADAPYLSYDGRALPAPEKPLIEPEAIPTDGGGRLLGRNGQRIGEGAGNPVVARTYRIAFATDPSYSAYFAPDATTDEEYNLLVTAAKATLMNRVNQIYGDDMSLQMLLVDETDKTNFNTAADAFEPGGPCGATACYDAAIETDGCSSALLNRNRLVLGQVIGAENFDVGHIGLGINGGGIAALGVVGLDGKARGCTGLPFPVGDFYAIDYVAHEIGHQFAGNHTFNGLNGSCAPPNRNADTSVEPGSGSSVMAYAGICAQDDLQPHTDPYFSQRSQTEIGDHVLSDFADLSEIESVLLTDFGGTDSFRLDFPGYGVTAPITNGTNYTTAGIKAAVEAVTGTTVTVAAHFDADSFDTSGFQMTFGGGLAGTAIANPTLEVLEGELSAVVNDIRQGGPAANGGDSLLVTDNHVPTVTAPAAREIPVQTPFELTGSGEDVDGGDLIYLWEQNDEGPGISLVGAGTPLPSNGRISGPLFRVFGAYADVSLEDSITYLSPGQNAAGTTPTRTFPDIEQIIAGSTNAETGFCPPSAAADTIEDGPVLECYSEMLPTASYLGGSFDRTLNFRLTARDLGGAIGYDGGTSFDDTALTVNALAGPFLVDSQATATTVTGDEPGTIDWTTAQTDILGLADDVSITLSTDGGRTYPITLLESTPNDGSEDITWPNVDTSTARVKVAAVDNYFFDINDADITIEAVAPDPALTLSGTAVDGEFSVQYSDSLDPAPVLSAESATIEGEGITASAEGLPTGMSLTRTSVSAPGVLPGTATFEITGATTDAPGSFEATATVSDGAAADAVADLTVEVALEDATPTYTGPAEATATSGGTDAVDVTLSADVVETDEETGDLTLATATFVDTVTEETLCTAPVTASGTAGQGTASCSFGADLTGTADRTYQVATTVGGERYAGASAEDAELLVRYDAGLVVTGPAETASVDYSDPIDPTFEVVLQDRFVESGDLSVTATGLPAGLQVTRTAASAAGELPGTATYAVTGEVVAAPGEYDVVFTASDGGAHPDQTRQSTITVTREDATVLYTGDTSVTAPAGQSSAPVEMSAEVTASDDGTPGDVATATVTFTDTTTGTTLCEAAPVTQTAPGVGTATCTVTATFPADDGRTYSVALDLDGRYAGASTNDAAVTVEQDDVVVDTTPPETTITDGPRRGSFALDRAIDFAYESEPGATYSCSLGTRAGECPADGSVTARGVKPGTYDFSVAATDAAGNTDATPATRRFSVPFNDRKLKNVKKAWDRTSSNGSFRGTYLEAADKGSTLKIRVTDAVSMALIYRQAPGLGAVDVFLGKTKLRTIRTSSNNTRVRKLSGITKFSSPTSGVVRIKTRNGKTVQVEGLGVRTSEVISRRVPGPGALRSFGS